MKEDVEIVDELHELDGVLKSFPPEAHWFCPKRNDDDSIDYSNPDESDEDTSSETKQESIKDSKKRGSVAYKYSLILGLAPEQTGRMLVEYTQKLNHLLSSCDKCVFNWHVGRRAYLKGLSEQFDDEVVAEFSNRLNILDFERLDRGLQIGQNLLAQADPKQRTQSYIAQHDGSALIALYEALCCVDYHKDDRRLHKYFDYVFEEIQARKVLRISDVLPATARFLFSQNQVRLRFATVSWQKMTDILTAKSFEWVVHDVLQENIIVAAALNAQPNDIQKFWSGFLLMLEKMDEELINHSLCAMEVQPDIYKLALQHLSCNSESIAQLVIQALGALLRKAPKAFWSAMGSISPSTIAELIFKSPGFELMLQNPRTFENLDSSPATSWISDFLNSLVPAQKYEACRTIVLYSFERLQLGNFSESVKTACVAVGLGALHTTLETFTHQDYHINATSSLIIIGELMKVVEPFMKMIVACAELQDDGAGNSELKRRARLVIQDALTLDCKAINVEYYAHAGETKVNVQRGTRKHSQGIWQAALDIFRPGDVELAKSILPAITSLIGLDELRPASKRHPEKMPPDQIQFNKDFHELMDNIARIIERLSDFKPTDLSQLCQSSATARPLFAALISVDQGISEAAVEVIKATTEEIVKVDAIQCLLETAFVPMLSSLTYAENLVSRASTFGSTPYIVKTGRELLKGLCGNTGVLRARGTDFSSQERSVTMQWWKMQWHILDRIFSLTESWSPRVDKSTEYMQDFIRDCMEYAEELFDQYSVFASALRAPNPSPGYNAIEGGSSTKEAIIRVLDIICKNVNGLVGMLRLRDHYLISVATKLLVKLLGCLGEYDLEIDDYAAKFIKASCRRGDHEGFKRTNLTDQQKAELQRALYEHQGVAIINDPKSTIKKQVSLDAWSKSADGKQHEPKLPITTRTESVPSHGIPNLGNKGKSSLEMMRAREAAAAKATNQNIDAFRERRRAEEEASRKLKAEAIAKARALRAPVGGIKGEGSGLRDINGIVGKDHAPIRSEIMVSSDESSDDEDDEDESNALIKAMPQRNKKVSEYEESRRRALQTPQGPVKKTKVQRSAKDLRARVEPNMDRLYLEILNWDIFHTGQDPPSNNQCRRIDNKYIDLDLYKMTFGPLLISEVWRSLVTAKDENNYKPVEIKILNRLSVDKFIEVSTSMPMAFNKDLKLAERDIVLLGSSPDPMNNQQEPHCLARVDRTTRKKDVIEVTYRVSRDVKVSLLQCFVPNGKVYCVKIADMTTTQREYAALSSLEYYDLCTEVLEAKPSPLQKYPEDKINSMSAKYKLNRGQANAILSANDNDGFTLIQGPPGSGKTKTIVAMVGAILTPILQQQQVELSRAKPQPGQKTTATPPPKKKLLICAPSNAAVDELVLRLKDGVQPLNGAFQKINVIRIGRSDAINASVKDVMLDELVRMKLEGDNGEKNKLINDRDKLHKDAAEIKQRLSEVRPALDEAQKTGDKGKELELRREFDQLKRQQAHIGAKIDEDKESGNTVTRQNEINRRRFQQEIIDGAHVLCATLSGSGHDMFRNLNVEFETVIIDEAAQCIELSALIPLKYGCSKCILVGDPEQLPPTVLSRSAQSFGYEQSLFVRMQMNHPKDVHLLDTQYRMHPEISVFPSKQFYGGRLVDGDGMARLRDQPWHASTILGPYRFFDVKGVQTQEARGHSFINVPELNAAIGLYQRLKADFRDYDFKGKIGIIATYKAQLNELRFRFERKFGDSIFEEIEFNTTDAFQGREREIIIFSCVRAKATGGIGFLSDIRRMNVGLTRAKSSLWVLGDSSALQQGEFWNRLIQDAKTRDRYTGGDVLRLLQQPTTRDRQSLREQQIKSEPKIKSESSSVARSSTGQASSRSPTEDSDVEMIDDPSILSSGKSSIASGSNSAVSMVRNPRNGPAGMPSVGAGFAGPATAPGSNPHGKRPRDSPVEDGPSKRTTPKPDSELEKALQAHQATKAAGAPLVRPVRPPGVPPPRKKAPADPFIQKKRPLPKR